MAYRSCGLFADNPSHNQLIPVELYARRPLFYSLHVRSHLR